MFGHGQTCCVAVCAVLELLFCRPLLCFVQVCIIPWCCAFFSCRLYCSCCFFLARLMLFFVVVFFAGFRRVVPAVFTPFLLLVLCFIWCLGMLNTIPWCYPFLTCVFPLCYCFFLAYLLMLFFVCFGDLFWPCCFCRCTRLPFEVSSSFFCAFGTITYYAGLMRFFLYVFCLCCFFSANFITLFFLNILAQCLAP